MKFILPICSLRPKSRTRREGNSNQSLGWRQSHPFQIDLYWLDSGLIHLDNNFAKSAQLHPFHTRKLWHYYSYIILPNLVSTQHNPLVSLIIFEELILNSLSYTSLPLKWSFHTKLFLNASWELVVKTSSHWQAFSGLLGTPTWWCCRASGSSPLVM